MKDMIFSDRLIAITDVETTGLDLEKHEIVEIGLGLVDHESLEIVKKWDTKVWPEHPETASPQALEINGYNEKDWQGAMSLEDAMKIYGSLTEDAVFTAWNVTFDWSFIQKAFNDTRIENTMDYHHLDIPSMVWAKLRRDGLESVSMGKVAQFLGMPEEPKPHRAINGAMTAYEIFKKLLTEV